MAAAAAYVASEATERIGFVDAAGYWDQSSKATLAAKQRRWSTPTARRPLRSFTKVDASDRPRTSASRTQ